MIWLLAYLVALAVALAFNYAAHYSPRRATNRPPNIAATPARGTTVETRKDADQDGASPVS